MQWHGPQCAEPSLTQPRRAEFFYLQVSKADPITEPVCSVKLMPLDAVAVTVTAFGVMQVAVPVLLIVAIELLAVLQLRSSAWVSVRLD
jgi:hypothetical protein